MKRLFLSSLLSCMVIGQIGAAASNSGEDARRAEQLERVEKRRLEDERLAASYARVPSLRKQVIESPINARIRAMGGKIEPTYIQWWGYRASEEDICFRHEFIQCIREATQEVRNELGEGLPVFASAIARYEQKLVDIWSAPERVIDGALYRFPDVQGLEASEQENIAMSADDQNPHANLCYNLRGIFLDRGRSYQQYMWQNRDVVKNAIDGAVQEMNYANFPYRQLILESVADRMKNRVDELANQYSIVQHRDNILQTAFFLAGAYTLYAGREKVFFGSGVSLKSCMQDRNNKEFVLRSIVGLFTLLKITQKIKTVKCDEQAGILNTAIDTVGHVAVGGVLGWATTGLVVVPQSEYVLNIIKSVLSRSLPSFNTLFGQGLYWWLKI